ncbi:MAG: hypothetical protein Terrestrivirus4_136 [Terrestrivirus sp.]|uniref:Uncharacterized protein n=1 Tax=Terrestrivirus sp. TaxID=2487775 RepID=A0A3G4ZMM6_9VIRU|nr:MAG: hypothetical protein Terrestrivirus4_136 [Terrestrivirus sp.]
MLELPSITSPIDTDLVKSLDEKQIVILKDILINNGIHPSVVDSKLKRFLSIIKNKLYIHQSITSSNINRELLISPSKQQSFDEQFISQDNNQRLISLNGFSDVDDNSNNSNNSNNFDGFNNEQIESIRKIFTILNIFPNKLVKLHEKTKQVLVKEQTVYRKVKKQKTQKQIDDEIKSKKKSKKQVPEIEEYDIVPEIVKIYRDVKVLECEADDNGMNEFMIAVRNNDLNKMKFLLPFIDINKTNNKGESALFIASIHNKFDAMMFIMTRENTNINSCNIYGNTILNNACEMANIDMVKFLLSFDHNNIIDINKKNYFGETAFQYACQKGLNDIAFMLVDRRDLDVNACDNDLYSGEIYKYKYLRIIVWYNRIDILNYVINVRKDLILPKEHELTYFRGGYEMFHPEEKKKAKFQDKWYEKNECTDLLVRIIKSKSIL